MWQRQLLRHTGILCFRQSPRNLRHYPACFGVPQKSRIGFLANAHLNIQCRSSHLSSLLERGSYDENIYKTVKGSDVKSLDVISDGRQLSIKWSDGKESKFHSVWLRYTCFCPSCRMDHTGQLQVEFDKVPPQPCIVSANLDGEGCLVVHWKDNPEHTGIFPLRFLKANCYSKESLENRREAMRMTFSKDNSIPRVKYDEVMSSDNGVYKWVKALNETGITVMEGVPCEDGMVKKVCQKIADIMQHTIYGETFDVVARAQPINAAYAAGELKLHMDQPMYESPPGIQALHCIKFDENIVGGDNKFVDLFQVAEAFRVKHPAHFDVLCKVPVAYETLHYNRDWPVHMRYQRPMFSFNKNGDLTGIVWHPHLIGTQLIEDEAMVEPFFEAFGKFYSMINNFPHCFRHRLRAGEMVAFNNRRVLHGRASYSNQAGERFLQGTYVEISEFKSRVQQLSNLVGDGRPPVRVGDFDLQ